MTQHECTLCGFVTDKPDVMGHHILTGHPLSGEGANNNEDQELDTPKEDSPDPMFLTEEMALNQFITEDIDLEVRNHEHRVIGRIYGTGYKIVKA